MPEFNPAHRTPPAETTPEEAERNKRIMGQNKAPRQKDSGTDDVEAEGKDKAPNPGKATA